MRGETTPLTDEREDLLTKLGFEWRGTDALDKDLSARWHQRYKELVAFRSKNGHCRVLKSDPWHRGLAIWARAQRRDAAVMEGTGRGSMTPEQWDALDRLGFFDEANWRVRRRRGTVTGRGRAPGGTATEKKMGETTAADAAQWQRQ